MKRLRTVGLLAVALALPSCGRPGDASETVERSARVETATVVTGPIERRVEGVGVVDFDPQRVRVLVYPREGQVHAVRVVAGQAVEADEPLLELAPAARDGVAARQARIELSYAEKEQARVRRLHDDGLAGNAELQAAEKAIANARAALDGLGGAGVTTLAAPGPSVVVEVLARDGTWVGAGEPALSLAPQDALLVQTGVEPEDAAGLAEGARVTFRPLFGAAAEPPAAGTVARIERRIDAPTQRVPLLARVEAAPPWLVAGASVRVEAVVAAREQATLVPRDALLERDSQTGVFLVDGGRAHWQPVELGVQGEEQVEIRSGLAAGQQVATGGRSSLSEGLRIRSAGEAP